MQVGTGRSILNGIAIGKLKIYKKKDTVISAAEEQHYKLVEIMWICSYSCAILFLKAQNGRYKFVGEKI